MRFAATDEPRVDESHGWVNFPEPGDVCATNGT
jgi:hypothetical protein